MKTIMVKVTQKHIRNGSMREGSSCPIALGLHDCGFKDVAVGYFTWQIPGGRIFKLSQSATKFIARFDNGKPVHPATFRLQAP